jgi:hypothetical protein
MSQFHVGSMLFVELSSNGVRQELEFSTLAENCFSAFNSKYVAPLGVPHSSVFHQN